MLVPWIWQCWLPVKIFGRCMVKLPSPLPNYIPYFATNLYLVSRKIQTPRYIPYFATNLYLVSSRYIPYFATNLHTSHPNWSPEEDKPPATYHTSLPTYIWSPEKDKPPATYHTSLPTYIHPIQTGLLKKTSPPLHTILCYQLISGYVKI